MDFSLAAGAVPAGVVGHACMWAHTAQVLVLALEFLAVGPRKVQLYPPPKCLHPNQTAVTKKAGDYTFLGLRQ